MKILIIITALLFLAVGAGTQTYRIDWYVIGSGGGHSSSPNYQVDGTIGQPIVGQVSSPGYRVEAGFWVGVARPSPCDYLQGDINGDNLRGGGDVTYGVRFFKLIGNRPPDSCYMDSTHAYLYVAGDVNGNCEFRGSDITRLVAYFKLIAPLQYCHFFPPPPFKERRVVIIPGLRD